MGRQRPGLRLCQRHHAGRAPRPGRGCGVIALGPLAETRDAASRSYVGICCAESGEVVTVADHARALPGATTSARKPPKNAPQRGPRRLPRVVGRAAKRARRAGTPSRHAPAGAPPPPQRRSRRLRGPGGSSRMDETCSRVDVVRSAAGQHRADGAFAGRVVMAFRRASRVPVRLPQATTPRHPERAFGRRTRRESLSPTRTPAPRRPASPEDPSLRSGRRGGKVWSDPASDVATGMLASWPRLTRSRAPRSPRRRW